MKEVKIGIIGFGTVGAGVASCLLENNSIIDKRCGIVPKLVRIADIDIETDRGVKLPEGILTTDAKALIDEVDVVVELVGGTTVAKDFILDALAKGKSVVTANKALLAEYGNEIFAASEKSEADIYYDASVAGGIPIIKILREGLVANNIKKMLGILNGTCNYILTRMENESIGFEDVLAEAQKLGYAEAEPSLDIDGHDTAHKAAILASLAYGEWFGMSPIYVEGIRDISLMDLKFASELGYRIKLLAVIKHEDGDVQIRVHPTLIPKSTLLADVSEVFNGIVVSGEPVGETMFYGRGAGRDATASSVVADLVDVALNLKSGSHRRVPAFRIGPQFNKLLDISEIQSRYYLRLQVDDKPGVTAAISTKLGEKNISISSIVQPEEQSQDNVAMLILTHMSIESSIKSAIEEIEHLDVVRDKVKLIRIEDV